MNKEDKVTIQTPYGQFWVRRCVLLKATKMVVDMLARWDEFSTVVKVGGTVPARLHDAPFYYFYGVEVGVYADTGNVYMKVVVEKEQRVIDPKTKAVSWPSEVVYTDIRSTYTLGR